MTGLAPNLHTAYGGLTAARLEMFLAAFRTPVLCHLAVEGQHLTVSSTSGVPSRNNAYFINLNEKSKLMPHYGTKAALSLPMPEGRGFARFLVKADDALLQIIADCVSRDWIHKACRA